jgi:hypothetical protein
MMKDSQILLGFCQTLELSDAGVLTKIDKQIIFKLFELSIHRYSKVISLFSTENSIVEISFRFVLRRKQSFFHFSNHIDVHIN